MSNFIELTNYDDGNIALFNLDTVEFITCAKNDGTVLVVNDTFSKHWTKKQCYHVRESYNLVKQLIRRTKSSPQFRCNMEFSEKAISIICDQLCRYPRECKDEYELEARCEHCPLAELEDEFCE